MKLRQGFVSNSSSTSFCIMGCSTSDVTLKPEFEEKFDGLADLAESSDDGLEYECIEGEYIGMSIYSMGQNETRSQFSARVKRTLEKYCTVNDDPDIIHEGGYEG